MLARVLLLAKGGKSTHLVIQQVEVCGGLAEVYDRAVVVMDKSDGR